MHRTLNYYQFHAVLITIILCIFLELTSTHIRWLTTIHENMLLKLCKRYWAIFFSWRIHKYSECTIFMPCWTWIPKFGQHWNTPVAFSGWYLLFADEAFNSGSIYQKWTKRNNFYNSIDWASNNISMDLFPLFVILKFKFSIQLTI